MTGIATERVLTRRARGWYVAGGETVDGHPGAEFNVLLIACLAGVLWTYWPRRAGTPGSDETEAKGGLAIIQFSAAFLLLPHALAPFVKWDLAGMREWGAGMSRLGFPFGVPLAWSVVSLQAASSFALLTRRLVVPASVAHIVVLTNGLWISHAPYWFMVGPENKGMDDGVPGSRGCEVRGGVGPGGVRLLRAAGESAKQREAGGGARKIAARDGPTVLGFYDPSSDRKESLRFRMGRRPPRGTRG